MKQPATSPLGMGLLAVCAGLSLSACAQEAEKPSAMDPDTPKTEAVAAAPDPFPIPPPPNPPVSVDERIGEVRKRVTPVLEQKLKAAGFALGDPVFIRIFKETRELEVWLKPAKSPIYKKWHTWPVAAMSGVLGPKKREGDRQAPEGFYTVQTRSLNPRSSYHLSFNIGYPNAHDLANECTGGLIMVHGNQVSIGCFAMTDPVIEQIYLLGEQALLKGQKGFNVHVFPFRMTEERMAQAVADKAAWVPFWNTLRPGYEAFETHAVPPKVMTIQEQYQVTPVVPKQPS